MVVVPLMTMALHPLGMVDRDMTSLVFGDTQDNLVFLAPYFEFEIVGSF